MREGTKSDPSRDENPMKDPVIDLVWYHLDVCCFYLMMMMKVSYLAELLMKSYREN